MHGHVFVYNSGRQCARSHWSAASAWWWGTTEVTTVIDEFTHALGG